MIQNRKKVYKNTGELNLKLTGLYNKCVRIISCG